MARQEKRVSGLTTFFIVLLILAILAATFYVIWLCVDMVNQEPGGTRTQSEKIVLPTHAAVPEEIPITTAPPTEGPLANLPRGELLDPDTDGIRDYVCTSVQPTRLAQAGDMFYYVICPDQEAALQALESALSKAYTAPLPNAPISPFWLRYQHELWFFYEDGNMVSGDKRIDPEYASDIYAICKATAMDAGLGEVVRPERIQGIISATLECMETTVTIDDPQKLASLESWLANSDPLSPGGAACWFTALLTMTLENGEEFTISMATDSCSTWLSEGVYYKYPVENSEFFALFGIDSTVF